MIVERERIDRLEQYVEKLEVRIRILEGFVKLFAGAWGALCLVIGTAYEAFKAFIGIKQQH